MLNLENVENIKHAQLWKQKLFIITLLADNYCVFSGLYVCAMGVCVFMVVCVCVCACVHGYPASLLTVWF
jgi:hypothetical protein